MTQQLRIFVSSTIGECAPERAAAKAAIASTRHCPILFEDLGSHPHPPRNLYLRELRSAQIFVGIYRERYGWVAPDMKISGVEDEHEWRTKLGLPSLIYVLRPAPARDARLAHIVEHAERTSTVAYYLDPAELEERIASDLTAIIAQGFSSRRLDEEADEALRESTLTSVSREQPSSLEPLEVELLSALLAASGPLTVEELAACSNEKSPAVVRALARLAGTILSVRSNAVTLSQPQHLLSQTYGIFATGTEKDFYTHQVATVFEREGRTLDSYRLLQAIGHQRADILLARAAREATNTGQIDIALPLLRLNLERAKREGEVDLAVSFLLSLATLSLDAGNLGEAHAALKEANALNAPDLHLSVREVELLVQTEKSGDEKAMRELAALRKAFEAEGDKYGAARVAITQSKLFIELHKFPEAVESARFALQVFTDQGDDDGRHVALHNLIASLSAQSGNEQEVRLLSASIDEGRTDTARMRAFQCNLAARRLRESGDPTAAAERSREAIAIGEKLGDLRLQLTNRINLGNALSDLGRTDEAVAEYKAVSAAANEASLLLLEGAATRLVATTLNDAKRWIEALPFAQHAAGLLRDTVDSKNFLDAKREEAQAQIGLGNVKAALDAHKEAAKTARRHGEYSKLGRTLLAIARLEDAGDESVFAALLEICSVDPTLKPADAVFALVAQMGPLLSDLPAADRGRVARLLFTRAIGKCPAAALGKVTESIVERLLKTLPKAESADLQVFANLLLSFDASLLSLRQWNVLAEKAAEKFPMLTFKPFNDGAGHWTVTLDRRVVATITEMDDSTAAFAATMCLALGLGGVGPEYLDALGTSELPRREAIVSVTTRAEFIELIGEKYAPDPEALVSATRAANEAGQQPPLIQAILGDSFQLGPLDELGGTTGASLLLSKALYEMARHLLKGEVSEKALIRRLKPVVVPFYR